MKRRRETVTKVQKDHRMIFYKAGGLLEISETLSSKNRDSFDPKVCLIKDLNKHNEISFRFWNIEETDNSVPLIVRLFWNAVNMSVIHRKNDQISIYLFDENSSRIWHVLNYPTNFSIAYAVIIEANKNRVRWSTKWYGKSSSCLN